MTSVEHDPAFDVPALRRLHESADRPLGALQEVDPQLHAAVEALGGDGLAADRPVGEQPVLVPQRLRGEVVALGSAAGLDEGRLSTVLQHVDSVAELNAPRLAAMVEAAALDPAEAARLGTTVSLFRLFDGDLALARAVRPAVDSVRDLVELTPQRWEQLLDEADVQPPPGRSRADLAAGLAGKVARTFASDAVITKVAPRDRAAFTARLTQLSRDELELVANTYPGLGVQEIVADEKLRPAQRAQRIVKRVDLLTRVRDANPDVELLELDFCADSTEVAELRTPDTTPDDRAAVLGTLKAYQLVHRLGRDPAYTEAMLAARYRSSADVVRDGLVGFTARVRLPAEAAKRIYDRAASAFEAVTLSLGTVLDVVQGGTTWAPSANLAASTVDYLRKVDGYAELFGSQSSCRCEHCSSILSPAAYFVDLMSFVDEHVSRRYFAGPRATDELNLITRRPDLWQTPLTCENTNTLIPTLDVINEISENYAAQRAGYAGALADRVAVQRVVYEQTLSAGKDSFRQPFWLPLERLEEYLILAASGRAAVADALDAPEAVRTAARLRLSPPQYALVTTEETDVAVLRKRYGIDFALLGATGIQPLDAHRLLAPMAVDRDELGALLGTGFVAAGQPPVIKAGKSTVDSVQNDVERVHGLTVGALDRLHRLTRLWQRTTWTVEELDLALRQLGGGPLDPDALARLAAVHRLQQRLDVPLDELCGLFGDLPAALLDRLFNLPFFVTSDGRLPKPGTTFVHPGLPPVAPAEPATATLHRLLAGLELADDELLQLINGLAVPLGIDHAAGDFGFELSAGNFSLLYRHARLARLLGRAIPELFQLAGFAGVPAVTDLPGLRAVVDLADAVQAAGRSLDDLGRITGGTVLDPGAAPDPAAIAGEIVDELRQEQALTFAETLFAFLPGVTEEQSRAVVTANPTLIEPVPGGGRLQLARAFGPASTLVVPAGTPLSPAAARDVLLRYHPSVVVPSRLAARIGVPEPRLRALLTLSGADLADPALTDALRGAAAARAALAGLIRRVRPLALLFAPAAFDPAALAFVLANRALFGVTSVAALDIAAVRQVDRYAALVTPSEVDFSTATPPVDPADVRAVLAAYTPARGFADADQAALARVLRVEGGGVAALRGAVRLPTGALPALERLTAAAELAGRIGVGNDALGLIAAVDYPGLNRAADAVLGALRARSADLADFERRLEPVEDRLRSRRRDALVDHLVHTVQPEFDTRTDLYHHFLIDTQLEGCARTTRVSAAISSVQLYVHRILMNLEQDGRDPADPARVHVPPASIPADEWNWRRNYRVWEANRKVFLYPENYLEPQLRDDKTPQFRTLESELLQKEINDQNVVDAYATYLRGFDEVANLTIAGVYHDVDRTPGVETDVLHLLGATSSDPPVYHYRTVANAFHGAQPDGRGTVWTPWRKVDVQIPVRKASPVVFRGRLHVFWEQFTTKPAFTVISGTSTFTGYTHRMALRFTTLRPDGSWTAPQAVALSPDEAWPYTRDAGLVDDPLVGASKTPKFGTDVHTEPRDSYALEGPNWDTPYLTPRAVSSVVVPGPYLSVVARNFAMLGAVDLFHRSTLFDLFEVKFGQSVVPALCERSDTAGRRLFVGYPNQTWNTNPNALAGLLLEERRIDGFTDEIVTVNLKPGLYQEALLTLDKNHSLTTVSGSPQDAIIQAGPDVLLVQGSVPASGGYLLRRLGTTLSQNLNERLFVDGIDGFLATAHQLRLAEARLPVEPLAARLAVEVPTGIDYTGPYGVYYRELFFHIPFLIANHLNAQRRFEAAQQWYRYIFSPTADDPVRGDVRAVAAVGDPSDELHVFDLTTDGGLGYTHREHGSWDAARTDLRLLVTGGGRLDNLAAAGGRDGVLHVCATGTDGALWHTTRRPDGYWQRAFGDVRAVTSNPGPVRAVACAVGPGRELHVVAVTADGGLWHALRRADGTWYGAFGDVKAATSDPGKVTRVACAVAAGGVLHVSAVTAGGGLWHTLRRADGTWYGAFGDVKAVTSNPGAVRAVACATDTADNVHTCLVTADGGLWHTYRAPDGSWQPFFGDVRGAAGSPGQFTDVSCATGAAGELPVLGVVGGSPWYARRRPDSWQPFRRSGGDDRDRNWRYREFRGLGVPKLREVLTDRGAIEAYRTDPFNPHAIARLRLSAYQKSTVMKTIDNLLDWGDDLFSQFTAESVNEAALLYTMAADILGEPPTELGDCGEGVVSPKTYAKIAPLVSQASPFLVELETWLIGKGKRQKVKRGVVLETVEPVASIATGSTGIFKGLDWKTRPAGTAGAAQAWSLARQVSPVFCVPANGELREYWRRVDDRLYKIRNCLDITGARRSLSPFAPEVDPRMLVQARAAGLSIADAMDAAGGDLPPYRFSSLIDRAKAHAATVQSFGAALLGALEKRDAEELTRLRAVHQQHLLSLTTQTRQAEIDAADDATEVLTRQRDAAIYRRDYYLDLATKRVNASEQTQIDARNTASALQITAGILDTVSGITHLIPELGSFFALRYGGRQVGDSTASWSSVMRDAAGVAEAVGASAGLAAGFQRRVEGWQHQVELAKRDIAVLDKQLDAAALRKKVALRTMQIHERTVEQAEELFELYGAKFTNLGLYTYLATMLQRLYREAYNGALATARLAEQAFRFERDETAAPTIGVGGWDAGRAGLLAGERLSIDLMNLERRYYETNYRSLEIDQAFSLNQLDPAALVKLRQSGECDIALGEVFFDLFYPGHYRRRIRTMRLTVPCITGPYVNVSATLTLTGSDIRREPRLGADQLVPVPRRRSVAVATSTAQADGGVFEMTFRDERYMPFEGAGAVSTWHLALPKTFRQFDYQTINDVILTVSYTAEHDDVFRAAVEQEKATAQGSIHHYLKSTSLSRVFSLRQDFSAAFHRLLHSTPGTPVDLPVTANYFPPFLPVGGLKVTRALLALRTKDNVVPTGLTLSLRDTPITGFAAEPLLGGLPAAGLGTVFTAGPLGSHPIAVTAAGSLAPVPPVAHDPSALDGDKLLDVLLYLEYRLA